MAKLPLKLLDRAKETCRGVSTGPTDSIILQGPAAGFVAISGIGDGTNTYYTLENSNSWEVGLATYATGAADSADQTVYGRLIRGEILDSSNNGGAIALASSDTATVFITMPAQKTIAITSGTVLQEGSILFGDNASGIMDGSANLTYSTGSPPTLTVNSGNLSFNTGTLDQLSFRNDVDIVGGDPSIVRIGYTEAGEQLTSSLGVAIGYYAGGKNAGTRNIAIGHRANYNNVTAYYICSVGDQAGLDSYDNNFSTNVGYVAGYNSSGTTQSNFGMTAGYMARGEYVVNIGYKAGQQSVGDNSVYIGQLAGYSNVGNNNIEIVTNSGIINNGFSNRLNIENVILADTADKLVAIGDVGTGTLTTSLEPNAMLDVVTTGAIGTSIPVFRVAGTGGSLISSYDNITTGNIFTVSNNDGLPLIAANASGDVILIENGRYVGIVTGTPQYQLDVAGTGNFSSGIRFSDGTVQTTAGVTTYTAGSGLQLNGTVFDALTATTSTSGITQLQDSATDGTVDKAITPNAVYDISGVLSSDVASTGATNAAAIATNTTNIASTGATNAAAIATNTTNIASTGATNAAAIATNTTNIASTGATNAAAIATNTTNIASTGATNAAAIAAKDNYQYWTVTSDDSNTKNITSTATLDIEGAGGISTSCSLGDPKVIIQTDGTGNFAALTFDNNVASISDSGDATFNNITATGNFNVSGTLTYIDSTTVTIADKQLELASNSGTAVGNDAAVNDGGIVVKSTEGDKKWTWLDATDAWHSTENISLASSKSLIFGDSTIQATSATGDISTVSGLTVTNATNIASTGATNAAAIATNVTNIATNATNITSTGTTNAANITTVSGLIPTYTAGTGLTLVGTEFNTAGTGSFDRILFDDDKIRLGSQAGTDEGAHAVHIGEYAGAYQGDGAAYDVNIGYYAGYQSSGDYNITMGYAGGFQMDPAADYNVAIGYYAGYQAYGDQSVYIGYRAGYAIDGDTDANSRRVAIGSEALYDAWENDNTVAIGYRAGHYSCSGYDNVAIGDRAGAWGGTTFRTNSNFVAYQGNTAIGHNAFYNPLSEAAGSDCLWNTVIGYQAGYQADDNGDLNFGTFVGARAGYNCEQAYGNTAVGLECFRDGEGSYNTTVGYQAGKSTANQDFAVSLGYRAGYSAANLNFTVDIGYKSCQDAVRVYYTSAIGYQAGRNADADYSIFLGYNAGAYCVGDYNIEFVTNGASTSILDDLSNKIHIENTIVGDTSAKKLAIGNVGVGDVVPDATVEIKPNATTDVGLIVQGASSQSANLTEWQDSSETVLAYVDKDGSVSGNNISASGSTIMFTSLPTSDPSNAGQLWRDGTDLKISVG
jgi:hypothetical protein